MRYLAYACVEKCYNWRPVSGRRRTQRVSEKPTEDTKRAGPAGTACVSRQVQRTV